MFVNYLYLEPMLVSSRTAILGLLIALWAGVYLLVYRTSAMRREAVVRSVLREFTFWKQYGSSSSVNTPAWDQCPIRLDMIV